MSSSGGEDANYLLAKAVVGRYAESYLPGIKEHQAALGRGVEVVGESLKQRRRSRSERRGGDELDSATSSLAHEVEVEWMVWSRIAPPGVALYVWWAVFAIWRELDDGTTNRDRVKTWLMQGLAGLAVLSCVLALVVWGVAGVIKVFSGSKSDPPPGEGNKSIKVSADLQGGWK